MGIRKVDKTMKLVIRELFRVTKEVNERIDEYFSGGLAMWRKWRMIELLRGCL